MSQLSTVDPKPNGIRQQACYHYLSWFGYWLASATLDFSVPTITWWLDFTKSPRLPHMSGVSSWLSARTSAGPAGWNPTHGPSLSSGFLQSLVGGFQEWTSQGNREKTVLSFMAYPWRSCYVTSAVFTSMWDQGKGMSIPHLSGRGVSITLSDKGWKILSWKIKSATVTWDVSERGQWGAVLVNSSFFMVE